MREILFRGKRKDNGEWVYGDLVHWADGMIKIETIYDEWEIIPETLGQFAGLLDKNGTKIYEGDIVKEPYGLGWEGIVIFEKGQFIVDIGSRWIPMWEYIEVIGNIHEENNNGTTAND